MISIDNAVELMVKTYIGLPKRISGHAISRRELQEIGESFPALLDALEKYAPDKLTGIDLGTIEWYHRLRNELYHQGNGLTVERGKVEIYVELANVLFENLFGQALVDHTNRNTELLGEFLAAWANVERGLRAIVERELNKSPEPRRAPVAIGEGLAILFRNHLLTRSEINELGELRQIRNLAAHGQPGWESMLSRETIGRVRKWAERLVSAATLGNEKIAQG